VNEATNQSSNILHGPIKNKGISHRRIINRACVQVLTDPQAHPREKMKAAGILERMDRERDLARRRKQKKTAQISAKSTASSKIEDILHGAL
jgi:hypothetical protein